jgi:ribosomal protein L37AE/L43A
MAVPEAAERADDECPRCGQEDCTPNPIADGWYECNSCVIAFSADGEVADVD